MDQTNILERNHQVGLMSEVFSSAHWVLAWLGGAPSAFFLDQGWRYVTRENDVWNEDHLHAAITICTRPYWSRIWIVQELLLAKGVRLWCGMHEIRDRRFWKVAQKCDQKWRRYSGMMPEEMYNDFFQGKSRVLVGEAGLLSGSRRSRHNGLFDLLNTYSHNLCTDPLDRIFGLQAIVHPQQRVLIDYSRALDDLIHESLMIILHSFRTGSRQSRAGCAWKLVHL